MNQISTPQKIFFVIFILIVIAFCTFGVLLFTLLLGGLYYIPLIITIALLLFLLFAFMIFQFFKTKKRKIGFALFSVIVLMAASSWPIYQAYIDSIPTVSTEVDVFQYVPFEESSKLVSLEEESTLKLSEPLPIIDGATAFYPLYAAFAQATYPEKEYMPYESEVMVNTTPYAYENLMYGKVDMIFVFESSKEQMEKAKKLGVELTFTPIGKESFVFFVNQKNEIDGLTLDQIKDIYSGKITNWKDVGGKNVPIRAYQRPEGSGSQTALQALMKDVPIMEAPRENIAAGMGEIINRVSEYRNFENSIGYTFRYYSQEMVGNNQIKLLSIDGVEPTKETIRSGEYPITMDFYIVTAGSDNPNVQKFIDWVLSPQGQGLVEKVGYVPMKE